MENCQLCLELATGKYVVACFQAAHEYWTAQQLELISKLGHAAGKLDKAIL